MHPLADHQDLPVPAVQQPGLAFAGGAGERNAVDPPIRVEYVNRCRQRQIIVPSGGDTAGAGIGADVPFVQDMGPVPGDVGEQELMPCPDPEPVRAVRGQLHGLCVIQAVRTGYFLNVKE